MKADAMVWLILAAFLIAVNVRAHYYSPGHGGDIVIAQTHLSSARDSVLLEKRPLVILDRVADHAQLVRRSAFRLLHVKAFHPRISMHMEGDPLLITTARFTMIHQSHRDWTRVEIRHPVTGSGAIVVLHRHQTLVLPPRWRYACLDGSTTIMELHDLVSLMLRMMCLTKAPRTSSRQA